MTWVFKEYSDLPTKFEKKSYELALLEKECRKRRNELYKKRDAREEVDENLIETIEELNSRIVRHQLSLVKRQEHIREILQEFDSHLDELDLEDFHTALK
ncbi:MAG: hypothetical protein WB014_05895 [Methanosarcina sp.]